MIVDFKEILEDYDNLIKMNVTIPLNNGDVIKFSFGRQNLAHLLGLHYLVDIPELEKFANKEIGTYLSRYSNSLIYYNPYCIHDRSNLTWKNNVFLPMYSRKASCNSAFFIVITS